MNVDRSGPLFNVTLSHDEVVAINTTLDSIPEIGAYLKPLTAMWTALDRIGDNRGLSLTGVIGYAGIVTVPATWPLWNAAKAAWNAVAENPTLFAAIATGIPWLALLPGGDEADTCHFNAGGYGDKERLLLITNTDSTVSFRTHRGWLGATEDGAGVWGNQTEGAANTKWEISHHDSYPELPMATKIRSTFSGRYLSARRDQGGCPASANAPQAGNWEEMRLEADLGGGTWGLRAPTDDDRSVEGLRYLSVA